MNEEGTADATCDEEAFEKGKKKMLDDWVAFHERLVKRQPSIEMTSSPEVSMLLPPAPQATLQASASPDFALAVRLQEEEWGAADTRTTNLPLHPPSLLPMKSTKLQILTLMFLLPASTKDRLVMS